MKIVSLHTYPIKGFRGIDHQRMNTAPEGFTHDRRWMLVDANGTFLSQRSHPQFALFMQSISEDHLVVNYKDVSIQIPIGQLTGELLDVRVFDNQMKAREVSKEISQSFSDCLGQSVRLVGHGPDTKRQKQLIKGPPSTAVSFADGYPYLIVGTASLQDLNRRLDVKLPMTRFRPNIVVETSTPHEEDQWDQVSIGQQSMQIIKPCARCQVTTVDQMSGIRGKEPLKTLSTYRKIDNKVYFGANAISLNASTISVGNKVVLN